MVIWEIGEGGIGEFLRPRRMRLGRIIHLISKLEAIDVAMIDQKLKKRAVHRAKILEGQMKGLTRAIEQETYCIDLLRHSLSIQKSLQSLNVLLLEQHLRRHVKHQMKSVTSEEKAIKELLAVFELHNR